jgi:acetoin utilization protein AcuB
MLIQEWMSRNVITANHKDTLNDAIKIFRTRIVSVLPVLKTEKLIGIITDGDIKKASPSDATTLDKFEMGALMDGVLIESIMSKPVITIRSNRTVGEAARVMLRNAVSGLPVLDRAGNIEGIITKSDIFRCFVSFAGITDTGQIFAFKLPDKPGMIKGLTDRIRKSGGRLGSIMTSYEGLEKGYRKIFIHSFDLQPDVFDSLIKQFQETVELLYTADLSRGLRTTY